MTLSIDAVTYPVGTPASETTGGYFNTYFSNMFTDCYAGEVLFGFGSTGLPHCQTIPVSPVSNATLSLSGALVGTPNYVVKYTPTGTGINDSQIFDDGTNVGVGTAIPSAKFEVNGQVKITGGTPGLNRVLTSDATGLASWSSSIVGATATGITGGSENYISKFGTGGTGLYPSQFFDNGTNIGIGTATPGAKLDVVGTIRIAGGGFASGRVLTSDASGLASWQPSVSTADFALSGAFWRQTGNSGTTSATDYVGTADNQDLVFRRNSIEGMRLSGANSSLSTTADATINGVTVGRGASNIATNTANGYNALYSNITGYQNSAFGMSSLYSNNTGYNNTALGYLAGSNLTSGDNNIFIGYNTQPNIGNSSSNQINIGNVIYGYNGNVGIGVLSPLTRLDIGGNIRIADGTQGNGRVLTSDAGGIATWQVPAAAPSTTTLGLAGDLIGTTNYIAKYTPTGTGINNSQLYDTGTGVGLGTTTPGARLDIVGSVRIAGTGASFDYRPSNIPCTTGQVLAWSGAVSSWLCSTDAIGISGTGLTTNHITKWNGTAIANSQIYDNGTNIGIGTATPSAKLTVSGSALITGDITVQGKVITDTIVNRTVSNVTISGSLLPDAGAPAMYRDIGSVALPWNNLYLSNQIRITGGSPGLGKVLTSDATGLATWSSSLSGATATGITGGVENYISKFGTGGIGLYLSQMFDTGTGVGIGTATPGARLEVAGQVKITGGSPGLGKVLISDATGLASWSSTVSGATATGIVGGVMNYVTKFGTGGIGLYASQLFDNGTYVGIGSSGSLTAKLQIDSGIANTSGLRMTRISNTTPVSTGSTTGLGVDGSGNVVTVANGDVIVYDGVTSLGAAAPDNVARTVGYDFNKYFLIPAKQSFVVTDGAGPGMSAPYIEENAASSLCEWTGNYGSGMSTCPTTDAPGTPYNSFTMSARGEGGIGYQLGLAYRGDVPLMARSGYFRGSGTSGYGSGLYLGTSSSIPAPWFKVFTVPTNHIEYFYIDTGFTGRFAATGRDGNIGIGTATPDYHLEIMGKTTASTVPQVRIARGVQGSDSNLGVAYGTPYINIGGLGNRMTALQTIGFGYSALAGAVRYAPAEIGFLTTSIAGNTQGDIVFANRNGTTNVAPTEVVRITSAGSVGIGTPTPAAKLDVAGTFKLGTAGVATTAAGVCTIASTAITTTASNYTCTGVPASTSVALHCNATAAFTTPGTTSLYCRANGTANSVTCNTTVANSVASTYKCMWMQ